MDNPKAQYQIDNGNGWQTIAEVDIIDGVTPPPPNAWTMARVLHKQITCTGYTPVEMTVAPSNNNPRDTHFLGYARAVVEEIYGLDGWYMDAIYDDMQEEFAEVIAHRTHDLACHILMHAPTSSLQHCCSRLEAESCIESIPDMPELPEVKE